MPSPGDSEIFIAKIYCASIITNLLQHYWSLRFNNFNLSKSDNIQGNLCFGVTVECSHFKLQGRWMPVAKICWCLKLGNWLINLRNGPIIFTVFSRESWGFKSGLKISAFKSSTVFSFKFPFSHCGKQNFKLSYLLLEFFKAPTRLDHLSCEKE